MPARDPNQRPEIGTRLQEQPIGKKRRSIFGPVPCAGLVAIPKASPGFCQARGNFARWRLSTWEGASRYIQGLRHLASDLNSMSWIRRTEHITKT